MTTKTWEKKFETALAASAKKARVSLDGLKWDDHLYLDAWGDRTGLVFYGASSDVNARAAKFFEAWSVKNKLGSGYPATREVTHKGHEKCPAVMPFYYSIGD